jgi:transcriptional regulator with XRE-family HTH domain
MEESSPTADIASDIDRRIAGRLRDLRAQHGWSLDGLAARTGISRASLSRLEHAEVSASAQVLGRLCAAYGLSVSRLMHEVEAGGAAALVPAAAQPVWRDPETGLLRRQVSPPAADLAGEVLEGRLPAGRSIAYPVPPRAGLAHHLVLLEGALSVTLDGRDHRLGPGDALRYRLTGPSAFAAPAETGARYLLFVT